MFLTNILRYNQNVNSPQLKQRLRRPHPSPGSPASGPPPLSAGSPASAPCWRRAVKVRAGSLSGACPGFCPGRNQPAQPDLDTGKKIKLQRRHKPAEIKVKVHLEWLTGRQTSLRAPGSPRKAGEENMMSLRKHTKRLKRGLICRHPNGLQRE